MRLRYYKTESYRNYVVGSVRAQRYDLILADSHSLNLLSAEHQLSDLTELRQLIGHRFDQRSMAACGKYGIPYSWGTMGIFYRSSLQPTPIDSWAQLLTPPKAYQGGILMNSSSLESTIVALLALGKNPYSTDPQELREAYALLKQQRPHLLTYEQMDTYLLEHPKQPKLSMAMGYSGNVEKTLARTGNNDWQYVVPKEGTVLWTECLVVPKNALYHQLAQAFIAFINQPQHAADNAEEVWITTPNQPAKNLTSSVYQNDPILYPDARVMNRTIEYELLPVSQLRLRSRMIFSLR